MQENDMELDYLPEGSNLSESYTIQDNDFIQKKNDGYEERTRESIRRTKTNAREAK